MVFLVETLLSDVKILNVVNNLGFSLFLHVPSQRKWRGLLCIWRPRMDDEPVYVSTNIMALLLYSDLKHLSWLLTFDIVLHITFVYCSTCHC